MHETILKLVAAVVAILLAANYLLPRLSEGVGPSNVAVASSSSTARQTAGVGPETTHQGASYGRVELKPDQTGQYHAAVEIDGRRLAMLVDTGASFVALTYADSASIGFRPMPSDFKIKMMTANGTALAALTQLREVRVDTLLVDDVQAVVMPEGLAGTSLLGMSFLKKLGGFEIDSGNLILKP